MPRSTPPKRLRRYLRFAMDKRIKVSSANGAVLHGRCTNVSEGGLGATIAGNLAVGDAVEVEIALDRSLPPARSKAIIRNASGFHYGFEFQELPGESRRTIQKVLAANRAPLPEPSTEES